MISYSTAQKYIIELLAELEESHRSAIFMTSSKVGQPHGTFMTVTGNQGELTLVTVTLQENRKVQDIVANPRVEWLFFPEDNSTQVHLQGSAEVLSSAEADSFWEGIASEKKTAFASHLKRGRDRAVIRTTIDQASFSLPHSGEFHHYEASELVG